MSAIFQTNKVECSFKINEVYAFFKHILAEMHVTSLTSYDYQSFKRHKVLEKVYISKVNLFSTRAFYLLHNFERLL